MSSETLAAIGALIGAIGALIPQISAWLRDRSQLGVERRRMELVGAEIDLISKWLEATADFTSEELNVRRSEAERRLAGLLQFPDPAESSPHREKAPKPPPGAVQNLLFYTYTGFYLFVAFGFSIDAGSGESSLETLFAGDNMTYLTVLAVPLVALYFARERSRKVREPTE